MSERTTSSKVGEGRFHQFIRPFYRRLLTWRGKIRFSEEALHLVLAGCVGVIGGGTNLVFLSLSDWLSTFIWSFPDGSDNGFSRAWLVIMVTAGGGLAAGLVLHLGLRYVRQQGSSNFLEAVFLGDGRLPFRTALVKGFSSLISIASGAPVGREGSITQLTATFASKWGQLFHWPPYRLRLLVACGAASGMAAAYNAPIAGAVFAAQIVLGNFAMNLFAPLVFASVIAAMVSRSFFGLSPLYDVPSLEFANDQLFWFLLLGVLCGAAAAFFQKALRWSESAFGKLKLPIYMRLALGGLLVGLLAIGFPGVIGNGYQATSEVLQGSTDSQHLLGLTFLRLVVTVCAVGAGTLGGVFTPTLFLGAGIGGLYFFSIEALFEMPSLTIGAFVLVGMSGLLAGTTHAPLLAMIMILELTLNYSLMPPLMLTCAIATLVARGFHRPNVYSEGLELKGLAVSWETERIGSASRRRIGDLMLAPIPPLRDIDSFDKISERFIKSTYHFLPVVDADKRLVGIVALQDLKGHLTMGDHLTSVIAMDVMRPPPEVLTPNQHLDEALTILLSSEARNVSVVNNLSDMRLIGVVVRSEALGLLSEAIASKLPMSSGK
ncbi:MAG: Voltage-gated ClC-type chloride channel ClcB [Verrucomicrobia subdivision 3 bacterium]|nr:Voltage-gated ClC-type chloride channel ClcB [Limisphaerales bacterium]MCS1417388.1 Voltage-gated ClC-type chloride channel ClcB [Limisphaerales bacterium]